MGLGLWSLGLWLRVLRVFRCVRGFRGFWFPLGRLGFLEFGVEGLGFRALDTKPYTRNPKP